MPSTLLATRRLAPAASAASRISIGIDEIDAACRNRSGKSDRVTTNIRRDNNWSVMQLRQLKFGQARTQARNIISYQDRNTNRKAPTTDMDLAIGSRRA